MKPHVCGMARIVALAINLRHSQRGGKKNYASVAKGAEKEMGNPFSLSPILLPFAGFWVFNFV